MNWRRILIPLSADPIHRGHLRLISDARNRDDVHEVIVCVLDNPGKNHTLDLLHRHNLADAVIRRESQGGSPCRVRYSSGSLPDVWVEEGQPHILRGIRNEADLEYEKTQTEIYEDLGLIPKPYTLFHPCTSEALRYCSSSAIKAAIASRLSARQYCPSIVEKAYYHALHGQRLVCVTGRLASGKSTLCRSLCEKMDAEHIDVDTLVHEAWNHMGTASWELRLAVNHPEMPLDIREEAPRELLRNLSISGALRDVQGRLEKMVETRLRARLALSSAKYIFIEWAMLAEMGLGHWSFHNVIVVDTPEDVRRERAMARGVSDEYFEASSERQATPSDAIDAIRMWADAWWEIFHFTAGGDVCGLVSQLQGVLP